MTSSNIVPKQPCKEVHDHGECIQCSLRRTGICDGLPCPGPVFAFWIFWRVSFHVLLLQACQERKLSLRWATMTGHMAGAPVGISFFTIMIIIGSLPKEP